MSEEIKETPKASPPEESPEKAPDTPVAAAPPPQGPYGYVPNVPPFPATNDPNFPGSGSGSLPIHSPWKSTGTPNSNATPPRSMYPPPFPHPDTKIWGEHGPPPAYPYPPFPPPIWGHRADIKPIRRSSPKKVDVDGREGATSPTQIETSHREDVQQMGCTCKKTKCLKLYCQCFGVLIFCGTNCRCLNCYNTPKFDKQRKDAMRGILSRNPNAFDTKFKKAGQVDAEAKLIAHKLGCKCRKSNCMKKYCECYAGNVNCSSNCRCVGCKNTGGGHFFESYEGPRFALQHPHPTHVLQAAQAGKRQEALGAAENLTFLKRSTPEKEKGDEDDSEESPEKEQGIDSLMMAAYAMTEFGQGSSPSKRKSKGSESPSRKRNKPGETEEDTMEI